MTAVLPERQSRELLDELREARAAADAAEVRILVGAAEYADLHPTFSGDPGVVVRAPGSVSWCEAAFDVPDLPEVTLDAPAELGLALGLSHDSGTRLLVDALELRHRLPRLWAAVLAGRLPVWRARRIAQRTQGQPADVVAWVDAGLADIAHRVGVVTVDRLLDEAMLRLHAEEREARQLEALDARYAHVRDDVSETGIARMEIAADLRDLLDFDDALAAVAAALAGQGCPASLDVRRSMAVGVLADPGQAVALLAGGALTDPPDGPTTDPGPRHSPTRRRSVVLHVHLSEEALAGRDPVVRCETTGQPLLAQQVQEWCGSGARVTVRPVLDLGEHVRTDAYEIPDRLREQVFLRDGHCAFPWCTRDARRCDLDHVVAYDDGGSTCGCNLAPLCRRHHRFKTHLRWSYTTVEPGSWLWTSPLGYSYLRDPTGTRDVTPLDRSPGDGCHGPPGKPLE